MLQIRDMCVEDLEDVLRLEREIFKEPWTENDYRKTLEDNNCIYKVACIEGHIVGMCGVRNIEGEGEITNVATDPLHRKKGVATLMLDCLLESGYEMGMEAFTLEVRENNDLAIQLYESAGFVREGMRKDFYRQPTENALIMWKR